MDLLGIDYPEQARLAALDGAPVLPGLLAFPQGTPQTAGVAVSDTAPAARRDTAPRDADGRCLECHAEIGHYNNCGEDPDPPCICWLAGDDPACPYHSADPASLVYPP